ncbi:Glycosyltransferase involved in cell wall bisynthesis [Paenibacillus tianmuensis]|uniref:Glycosyltransferase involved in cell wall bisynthesis n=1 Tax=Paenibacillus tianmuensis TaxID=624147 RepID=A0A1G4R7G3_9BACL|nr:glycosyltransferase [Paenibacillus tianmuensis]SCW52179.1 Glycosyltransferase involved in cell wall bisynthesis [Paenibacillus tianmuensis]
MKFIFFDTSNDGHHFYYNLAAIQGVLSEAENATCSYATTAMEPEQFESLKQAGITPVLINPPRVRMPAVIGRVLTVWKLIRYCRSHGYDRLHLMYLDCLLLPLLLLWPLLRGLSCTATMHWYPTRRSKVHALSFLIRTGAIRRLIVHGEFTRRLTAALVGEAYGDRIESVLYPQLHPQHMNREHTERLRQRFTDFPRPFLLAFGGTRYDKGLDLLLQAARFIEEPCTLIVAGKEEHFTRNDMERLLTDVPDWCRVVLDLGFIAEEDVSGYFEIADIVVLPYRRMFTGQSGPLTEAIVRQKLVIGPDHGEIGFTIRHYQLGLTFTPENIGVLASQLNQAVRNIGVLREELGSRQVAYRELIQPNLFMKRYGSFMHASFSRQ